MAQLESTATGVKDLFDQVVTFLIDPKNFTAGNEWKMLVPAVLDETVKEVILEGKGDGEDKIYVGMKIENSTHPKQQDIVLNGYAGFDANLGWDEQPGCVYHEKLLVIPLAENVFMNFFVSANTRRFIIIVEMSSQYEGGYIGFMKPVSVKRQYSYPLVVAGSYIQGGKWNARTPGHNMFVNPGSDTYGGVGAYTTLLPAETEEEHTSSFRLRHPDGTWRTALNVNNAGKPACFEKLCLWPCNTRPVETYTVYRKIGEISKLEDNMMYPITLYESHPVGNIGILDGVYFVGNRVDLAAKDTIVYKDKTYKVFNNIFRREDDSYCAIEWG